MLRNLSDTTASLESRQREYHDRQSEVFTLKATDDRGDGSSHLAENAALCSVDITQYCSYGACGSQVVHCRTGFKAC
jgi:hypothetical protein